MNRISIKWLSILFIWCIGIIIRISLLATGESTVSGGEALIGVMARDILHGQALPFFLYGHPFQGGGAFNAYLSVVFLWLFGFESIVLKFTGLLIFSLTFLFGYLLFKRHFHYRSTIFFCLLLSISPPIYTFTSLQVYGTHDLIYLLLFGIFLLHWEILYRNKNTKGWYFYFGIFSGFATWLNPGVAPIVVFCIIISYLYDNNLFKNYRFDFLIIGGVIGAAPFLIKNLLTGWMPLKVLTSPPYTEHFDYSTNYLYNFYLLLTHALPRALHWRWELNPVSGNYYWQLGEYYSLFGYLLIIAMMIHIGYHYRQYWKNVIYRIHPKYRNADNILPKPFYILLYGIVWVLIACSNPWLSLGIQFNSYWYFLPFLLILFMYLAYYQAPDKLNNNRSVGFSVLKISGIIFLFLTGIMNIFYIMDSYKFAKNDTSLQKIVEFLDKNELTELYANKWAKIQLDFESDGKFKISDKGIFESNAPQGKSIPQLTDESADAIIFAGLNPLSQKVELFLQENQIDYKKKTFITRNPVQDWHIYYSINTTIHPDLLLSGG